MTRYPTQRKSTVDITILGVLVLFYGCACDAQKQEPVETFHSQINPNINYRTNICDRQRQFENGDVELGDSLRGLNISVLMKKTDKYTSMDPKNLGIIPMILDELSNRAGFTWRHHDGLGTVASNENFDFQTNETHMDLLLWGIKTYDIYANWWTQSLDRLNKGASFPEGFIDGSLILIGVEDIQYRDGENENFLSYINLWGWLYPFEAGVWWLILLTMFLSTFAYQYLEYSGEEKVNLDGNNNPCTDNNNNNSKNDKKYLKWWKVGPLEHMYLVLMAFHGHVTFEPTRRSSRLFVVSLSIWTLIIVATYTANLASFYVEKNVIRDPINSIEDAIAENIPICIWKSVFDDVYISKHYPKARLVRKETEKEVFAAISNRHNIAIEEQECSLAITSVATYEEFAGNRELNGGCNLIRIGNVITYAQSGFALKVDCTLCTSLLRDVLNVHMIGMKSDGFISNIWNDHLSKTREINCNKILTQKEKESSINSMRLGLKDLAGTFLMHFVFTTLAIVCAIIGNIFQEQKEKKKKAELALHHEHERDSHPKNSSSAFNLVHKRWSLQNSRISPADIAALGSSSAFVFNHNINAGLSTSILASNHQQPHDQEILSSLLHEIKILNQRLDNNTTNTNNALSTAITTVNYKNTMNDEPEQEIAVSPP